MKSGNDDAAMTFEQIAEALGNATNRVRRLPPGDVEAQAQPKVPTFDFRGGIEKADGRSETG
jgi:hypothetical protein